MSSKMQVLAKNYLKLLYGSKIKIIEKNYKNQKTSARDLRWKKRHILRLRRLVIP